MRKRFKRLSHAFFRFLFDIIDHCLFSPRPPLGGYA
jgi:hypothetical protein